MNTGHTSLQKVYYSISEVAQMFGVNASLIRFWESEFDILNPQKNKKGDRKFTPKDIEHLRLIYHLVKEQGYTLDGAKEQIRKKARGTQDTLAMIESLKNLKQMLQLLRNQIGNK